MRPLDLYGGLERQRGQKWSLFTLCEEFFADTSDAVSLAGSIVPCPGWCCWLGALLTHPSYLLFYRGLRLQKRMMYGVAFGDSLEP